MCCDKPCRISWWVGKIYGLLCTNCGTFTPT